MLSVLLLLPAALPLGEMLSVLLLLLAALPLACALLTAVLVAALLAAALDDAEELLLGTPLPLLLTLELVLALA